MILNSTLRTHYRDVNSVVRVDSSAALPIEGVGDIFMGFQSDIGEVGLQLLNVAFVSLQSHSLLSLKQFIRRAHHSCLGDGGGDWVTLFCKTGKSVVALAVGELDRIRE